MNTTTSRTRCPGTWRSLDHDQVERTTDKYGNTKRSTRCPVCGHKVNVPKLTKVQPSYYVGAHAA